MNNDIQLKLQLFQAPILAIPLKNQPSSKLYPQPNFLIVDNIFDRQKANFPDGKGGVKEVTCSNTALRLVYRNLVQGEEGSFSRMEVLQYNAKGSRDFFNQLISKTLADVVDEGHEEMIANAEIINTYLPMLKFDGYLSDFTLEYDVEKSKEYLELLEESRKPKEVQVLPITEVLPAPVAPNPMEIENVVEQVVETPIDPI